MEEFEILQQFGAALALATLVGLEREREAIKNNVKVFGGIRTFPIIGLLGALTSYLLGLSEFLALALFVAFSIFMVVAYFLSSKITKSVGLTSELAAFLVFLVGFIAAQGQYFFATTLTLVTLIFLSLKNPLHLLAEKVKKEEMQSTIKFMIVAFIILPLLPHKAYGPFEAFDPYVIWLMVVFISGISFVSYLAVKFVGSKKGIGLTGFLAGLVSSTALALSFSAQSKKNKNILNPYVFAILIASSAMFFRILIEVSAVNPDLLSHLIYPMATMGAIGVLGALFFWIKKEKTPQKLKSKALEMESPFQLKPALKFGAFFAFILFISKAANFYWGNEGIYLAAFVSGLMDVDAITISMAQESADGKLAFDVATLAITIGAITNTFVKAGIFFVLGNKQVAWRISLVFVLMLIGGLGINLLL